MAMSCRYAAQTCARQLRSARAAKASTQMLRVSATTRRYNSTEAAATNPKITEIVDQISQLSLLETADLVSSLKVGDGLHGSIEEGWWLADWIWNRASSTSPTCR